jgi:S-adenosylmethionine:tRNA ribosyltransferase-isomerase
MHIADFDYHLPQELIAQTPIEPRDAARMLVLDRASGAIQHRIFRDLPAYLDAGDVIVLNQTRVIPARLPARKVPTGGAAEILLLRPLDETHWLAIVGGRQIKAGTRLVVGPDGASRVEATVIEERDESQRVIAFSEPIQPHLRALGETPLPPYITAPLADPDRYQTVYARSDGSAAAPTAGLHFTDEMLASLRQQGVEIACCTLHIGLDTFAPVRAENIAEHVMHSERAILSPQDAQIINQARLRGQRVIAIGTTAVRTLETAAIRSAAYGTACNDPTSARRTLTNLAESVCPWRPVIAIDEDTDLYITPGYRFRVVDRMVTNFHLPRSTLLMLVSAFSGREHILRAYDEAVRERYRFYSLGDCCLLL